MIYFIADTHFGDDSIRKYENRPFQDIQEMNLFLMKSWNDIVNPEDEVYLLGDFSESKCENILASLSGVKYLIKGNHDTNTNEYYRKIGFLEVYDKPIILESFWILSHKPLYVCENMPYANIFGHVHNSPIYNTYSQQHYCVSVERIGYKPCSFDIIKKTIKECKVNYEQNKD